jgi:hypothetical protein
LPKCTIVAIAIAGGVTAIVIVEEFATAMTMHRSTCISGAMDITVTSVIMGTAMASAMPLATVDITVTTEPRNSRPR